MTAPADVKRDAELAPSVWRILAHNFGEAIHLLRREAPINALDSSQWVVLTSIAVSWTRGNGSPSQACLAALSGVSTRTIRRTLLVLERLGLVCGVRENGITKELEVGPRLAPLLRDFAFCRDPKIWMRTPRSAARATTATVDTVADGSANTPDTLADGVVRTQDKVSDFPASTADNRAGADTVAYGSAKAPDTVADGSAGTPDTVADTTAVVPTRRRDTEPRSPTLLGASIPQILRALPSADPPRSAREREGGHGVLPASAAAEGPPSLIKKKSKQDLNSFSSEGGPTPDTVADPSPGQPVDAGTNRRLALDALAIRFRRAHPGVPLPRTCDATDVKLVEACTANGTWDVETLRQTHLDAIDGAFEKAPPERPPTPRYIWGQFRFFLAHAGVGRSKRLSAKPPKPKQPRPPEGPPASSEWLEQHMREASALLDRLPDVSAKPKPQSWARFVVEPE